MSSKAKSKVKLKHYNVKMNKDYKIWLTYNAGKQKIKLPVLPESIEVKNGSNNDSINIVGLGEIVIMQDRPALQFSWSSFFPAAKFPGTKVKKLTKPIKLVEKINKWKASKKPVRLISTAGNIKLYATIENFTYSEVGGDPGTYQYSISFKEYRAVKIRKVKKKKKKKKVTIQKGKARVDNTVKPQTYTVKKGDCLYNIAKKFYGKGEEYTKIRNANSALIAKHKGGPNMIWPGDVLTIP